MKSDDLLKAVGEADEKYINEADKYSNEAHYGSNVESLADYKAKTKDASQNTEDKSSDQPSDNDQKKRSIARPSQVYLALLSIAAAFALVIIVVQALNIYKKNNTSANSSMDVAYETGTTSDTATDEAASDSVSDASDDTSKSLNNEIENSDFSLDVADTEKNASSEDTSASEDAESESDDTNESEQMNSTTNSSTRFTMAAGKDYTFSAEIPEGLSYYNTTGADSRSVDLDYLPTDEATIILYPSDEKEDYLKDGNVIFITYYANGFFVCGTGLTTNNVTYGNNDGIMGTYSDTDYEYDYISFKGDNTDVVAINQSNWSEKYKSALEKVYESLKLTKL